MDVLAYVVDMKALLGLIAGIFLLIFIGSLILGGPPGEEQRDTDYGEQWEEDDVSEGGDELDVLVATRALLVPDPYDGRHLYVELDDGEVVHLFGRWLDDYHVGEPKAVFPCERFRPYADSPDPFDFEHPFRVECLGPPIAPLVADEPLSPDARRAGLAPADWERIPMSFDRLLRRIGATDASRQPSRVTDEQIAALEDALLQTPSAGGSSPRVEPSSPAAPASTASPETSPDSEGVPPDATTMLFVPAADEPLFSTSRDIDLLEDTRGASDSVTPPDDMLVDDDDATTQMD